MATAAPPAPQTAAAYAANGQPFDPSGWTRTGGNSSSDVYTNPQTGQVVYVGKDGRVQDSFGSMAQANGANASIQGYASQLGNAVYNKIGPPSTAGIQSAANDAGALERQFLQQMQQNPYAASPGVTYNGSAPVVGAASSVPGGGAAPAGGGQAVPGGPAVPGAAPATQAPTGPSSRSGIGHFTNPGPFTPSAPSPGSGNSFGGGPPVAAPPAAPPSVPGAPGMVATAMQAAQVDPTQQNQFRSGQLGLAGNLASVLAGDQPSVAQLQQQQAFGQQEAQQMGLAAAMGRGGNQALALRTAMGNTGQLGAQQAAASALLRAQEQATARGQMGDVLNSGRAGDIGLASTNAQLAQQGNQTNAQLQQQANANNQQAQIATRGQNIQNTQNQTGDVLQANKNMVDATTGAYNAQAQHNQANANMASTGLAAVSSLFSDKNLKKDIKKADPDLVSDFLSTMRPMTYKYRGSEKPEAGVLAQDVSKSQMGRYLVRETPVGKAIDGPRATGAILASLADMHKRLVRIEGSKAAS